MPDEQLFPLITYNGRPLDEVIAEMAEKNGLPKEPKSPLMLKVLEVLRRQVI